MTADLLRYQLAFLKWANQRALSAVAQLPAEQLSHDFKTADKTILGTLAHCYRAERVWLNRIRGVSVDFVTPGDDTLDFLQQNWLSLDDEWIAWAQSLTDESAASDLSYADLKGNPWKQPVWTIVMHVVNHSSHHRGQVIGFLRTLGHTPPDVDLIIFARQTGHS